MRVRLIKKFAEMINGIDLSHARVGSLMTLSEREGEMLIAEGWAVPYFSGSTTADQRQEAADRVRPLPPLRRQNRSDSRKPNTGSPRRDTGGETYYKVR
jgi:hypothetical protein